MKKGLTLFLLLLVTFILAYEGVAAVPNIPDTGKDSGTSGSKLPPEDDHPIRLTIPSIGLDLPIEPVGVNVKGEMDVPNGRTSDVGWYKNGTVPGEDGSAVLAAHVYAAFEDLRYVKPGSEIYITRSDGEVLKFVVEESKIAWLKDVSTYFLFERDDRPRLNLITCAGTFSRKLDTYTKRLIVYAVLSS